MKKGFTLSEVLAAIAVLGVIAMLTMPGFITNATNMSLKTAKIIENKHMIEAINRMRLENQLSASTSEEFTDKLQKYLNVQKRCKAANITECFASNFQTSEGKTIQTNTLLTGADMGLANSTSPVSGLVLVNGTTVILALDPTCVDKIDAFQGSDSLSPCIAILYDVNGLKNPNKVSTDPKAEDGKDILSQNFSVFECPGKKLGSLCIDSVDVLNMAYAPDGTYVALDSSIQPNYWAGAPIACANKNMRVPTMAELDLMYQDKLYTSNGLSMNPNGYWSSEGIDSRSAQFFDYGNGAHNASFKNGQYRIRCVR